MRDYFYITVDSEREILFAAMSGGLSPHFEDAAQFQYREDAARFAEEHSIKGARVKELYGM